jgi:AhpD family alkylhydroperoxidase
MMHWLENVGESIPEHSIDVKTALYAAMKSDLLDEVDVHACALAAALASANGELAFAIEMFGPLAKAKAEIRMAKTAVSVTNMHNVYDRFVAGSEAEFAHSGFEKPSNFSMKYEMYALAASIIDYCTPAANAHYRNLLDLGVTMPAIQQIAKIAAVINTIGKIAPEIDQLVPSAGLPE